MTHQLSSEANIGKIFLLVGFILGFLGSAIMIIVGLFLIGIMSFVPAEEETVGLMLIFGFYLVIGVVMLVGSILGVAAYKDASRNHFHKAGILGIISSLIPPLNIFTLVGAILCLTSREAKR